MATKRTPSTPRSEPAAKVAPTASNLLALAFDVAEAANFEAVRRRIVLDLGDDLGLLTGLAEACHLALYRHTRLKGGAFAPGLTGADGAELVAVPAWVLVQAALLARDVLQKAPGLLRTKGGRHARPASRFADREKDRARVAAIHGRLNAGDSLKRAYAGASRALANTPAAGSAKVMAQAWRRVLRDSTRKRATWVEQFIFLPLPK